MYKGRIDRPDDDSVRKTFNQRVTEEALISWQQREQISTGQNWMVENLWEKKEVHLTVGPSGAGKSTFIYQNIIEVADGRALFGRPELVSHPSTFIYVACDRSAQMTVMNLRRLGLDRPGLKLTTLDLLKKDQGGAGFSLPSLLKFLGDYEYVFIDGIVYFEPKMGKGMSYAQAMNYWIEARETLDITGQTLHGTYHCSKAKPNERYANPRDRVMGSVGTVGCVATVIDIQFADESEVADSRRIISVCPRNSKPFQLNARIGPTGLFEILDECKGKAIEVGKAVQRVIDFLALTQVGGVIYVNTVKQWAKTAGLSLSSVDRAVGKCEEQQWVRMLENGKYQVIRTIPHH